MNEDDQGHTTLPGVDGARRWLSRRSVLIAGASGLGVAGLAAGTATGALPFSEALQRALGVASPTPATQLGSPRVERVYSEARGREVDLVLMLPTKAPPKGLPMSLMLHGLHGTARHAAPTGLLKQLGSEVARKAVPPVGFVAVVGGGEAALFGGEVEALAVFDDEARAGDVAARREALQERRHRHHQHAALRRRQPVERGDALRNDVRMRREQVVGQGFPVGEMQYLEVVSGEYGELGFKRVRGLGIAGDRDHRRGMPLPGFGDQQGEGGAMGNAPGAPVPGLARQGKRAEVRGRHEWQSGGGAGTADRMGRAV